MSHPDPIDTSKSLQHIGFFAMPDSSPVVTRDIPEPFRLGEVGTGVFVMGFNPRSPEWTKEVTIAAIETSSTRFTTGNWWLRSQITTRTRS